MSNNVKEYKDFLDQQFQSPQEAAAYLSAALEDSEDVFLLALRDVIRARQFTRVADAAGTNRENLYRALAEGGNPRVRTLSAVLKAIGLQLAIEVYSTGEGQAACDQSADKHEPATC